MSSARKHQTRGDSGWPGQSGACPGAANTGASRPPFGRCPSSPGHPPPSAGGRYFAPLRRLGRLHGDQTGTISIATVFALLAFTMLLVMIVNVGRHVDDKIKMQNAADASAYSGGVVLARGMNAVAFTNHLLADVFAMTAYLREGRERTAESLTPEILDEWEKTGRTFSQAEFQKFKELGEAILDKVPRERRLVAAFGEMTAAASQFALPVFEYILREHKLPEFQRAVLRTVPGLAQRTSREVAFRHGLRNDELPEAAERPDSERPHRGRQTGILWRLVARRGERPLHVGRPDENDPNERTLPVVDPADVDPFVQSTDYYALPGWLGEKYRTKALHQRRELAKRYLEDWTGDKLRLFDRSAEMSQFSNLWRLLTNAHLEKLLAEYPATNLPMQIRRDKVSGDEPSELLELGDCCIGPHLERYYHFVSMVYRPHLREVGPKLFQNPLDPQAAGGSYQENSGGGQTSAAAVTFAEIMLFLPKPRHYLVYAGQGEPSDEISIGGTFGFDGGIALPPPPANPVEPHGIEDERWPLENWPHHWDMLNQNWTVKLVPATSEGIAEILRTNPGGELSRYTMPRLDGVPMREIRKVNNH